jgi:hypothetical protein
MTPTRGLAKAAPELAAILEAVRPSVNELFGKLNTFNKNKRSMETLRATLVPAGALEAVQVETAGLWSDDGGQIKLEFYQRQLDGVSPVQSTDDLYAAAEAVLPLFTRMLTQLAAEAGVAVKLSLARLKGKYRAERKASDEYSDRSVKGISECGSYFP